MKMFKLPGSLNNTLFVVVCVHACTCHVVDMYMYGNYVHSHVHVHMCLSVLVIVYRDC